jgi:hypothetical protein
MIRVEASGGAAMTFETWAQLLSYVQHMLSCETIDGGRGGCRTCGDKTSAGCARLYTPWCDGSCGDGCEYLRPVTRY